MRDQLVVTGDAMVDAYLALARFVRCPQRSLEAAEEVLTEAQQFDRKHNGCYGTAEDRQRAEKRYDEAKQALDLARDAEDKAAGEARQASPRLFDLAEDEVTGLWEDFYGPSGAAYDRSKDDMPDDDTPWCALEPGTMVQIRYLTTGQVVTWQFVELGEPHPDNGALRIARYVERSRWRATPALVELAVDPEAPVGLHARSKYMTIAHP
ncbi:hypothetical protein ETD86_37335 [Nonomuraea turkmeniaca]|uniref:Uncharacterized protein n=1 Tax=Nonomuraea turkmeniaca TaxID=103838 RepID=A0A5S4F4A8_9ACTN|nr:hypothetical protein [Nonomuraea turkmeniaca]TMR10982.1 hypothetical protein ETD86_37335 [Nonomuraea turkmeniaca]